MNQIVFFRGRTAVSARAELRAVNIETMTTATTGRGGRRSALVAIWRRDPVDGRLECRWTDGGGSDEVVSRGFRNRLAA